MVGCAVLNVDYSKAPERQWPAAINDVDAAIRWARANAKENGWDNERISVGGFSAGGNLALCACLGNEGRDLKAVVAFYPPCGVLFSVLYFNNLEYVYFFNVRTDLALPANEKIVPKIPRGQAGVPLGGERTVHCCIQHQFMPNF
jgi:acetyl esterase/lipase